MPEKTDRLDNLLKELKSFVVAYSGGVDSSFLLYRAHNLKGVRVTGVTIRTPYIPAIEIDDAISFTKKYGIDHRIIDISFPESIVKNPVNRCYLCKKTLFTNLITFAAMNGYDSVIDGSNADDTGEYRPGLMALKELGIKSPLLGAGITKKEIREISRQLGLPVWDKPAMACLLTRIPYDTVINDEILGMVEKAEYMLFERGYPGSRVRIHGDLARIECLPGYLEKIVNSPDKELIVSNLKKLGFRYVSLDLEGYRTGSLNPETLDNDKNRT